jgi:nucleotide-binding universal stress UspA family protein
MTILVAYVPRPEGRAALDKGIEIATRRQERLVVVNASPGGKEDETVLVDGYEGERVEERLAQLPIQAEFKQFVRGRSTLDEIEALVTELNVSVLVIGLRKRTAVGKLLLGSMAQEILMTIPCPILAVKAP